jgi:hypothetical protein
MMCLDELHNINNSYIDVYINYNRKLHKRNISRILYIKMPNMFNIPPQTQGVNLEFERADCNSL